MILLYLTSDDLFLRCRRDPITRSRILHGQCTNGDLPSWDIGEVFEVVRHIYRSARLISRISAYSAKLLNSATPNSSEWVTSQCPDGNVMPGCFVVRILDLRNYESPFLFRLEKSRRQGVLNSTSKLYSHDGKAMGRMLWTRENRKVVSVTIVGSGPRDLYMAATTGNF